MKGADAVELVSSKIPARSHANSTKHEHHNSAESPQDEQSKHDDQNSEKHKDSLNGLHQSGSKASPNSTASIITPTPQSKLEEMLDKLLDDKLSEEEADRADKLVRKIKARFDTGRPLTSPFPLRHAVSVLYRHWLLDGTITLEMLAEAHEPKVASGEAAVEQEVEADDVAARVTGLEL